MSNTGNAVKMYLIWIFLCHACYLYRMRYSFKMKIHAYANIFMQRYHTFKVNNFFIKRLFFWKLQHSMFNPYAIIYTFCKSGIAGVGTGNGLLFVLHSLLVFLNLGILFRNLFLGRIV